MNRKPLELFFVGNRFYSESDSIMGPLYETGTNLRNDWADIQTALDAGKPVSIRPATKKEMAWAEGELSRIQTKRKSRGQGEVRDRGEG